MRSLFLTLAAVGVVSLALTATVTAAPEPMKIGDRPADFALRDPSGNEHALFSKEGTKATVVLFIATQCPVSNAYNERMAALHRKFASRGVRFLAINSNKQESAAEVAAHREKSGFQFPVVKDPNNVIADRWGALVTPEAFVLDHEGTLRYHGRIDDNQNPSRVTSRDLETAIEAVLAGKAPEKAETKAVGCTIKRI